MTGGSVVIDKKNKQNSKQVKSKKMQQSRVTG
jgi:hypothetical protein